MTSKVLQATNKGCAAAFKSNAAANILVAVTFCSVITLSKSLSRHLMRGKRERGRAAMWMLASGCLSSHLWSSLVFQMYLCTVFCDCIFANVEAYSGKIFYALRWLWGWKKKNLFSSVYYEGDVNWKKCFSIFFCPISYSQATWQQQRDMFLCSVLG